MPDPVVSAGEPTEVDIGVAVDESEPLLTTVETARRLGIARQTLYGLMSSGQISAVRIGGAWRIEPAELRRFIAESRTPRTGTGG
jgi:excisionase family DNA binding protein